MNKGDVSRRGSSDALDDVAHSDSRASASGCVAVEELVGWFNHVCVAGRSDDCNAGAGVQQRTRDREERQEEPHRCSRRRSPAVSDTRTARHFGEGGGGGTLSLWQAFPGFEKLDFSGRK
jgi:hypothetical protein